jgi:hypothetical protein
MRKIDNFIPPKPSLYRPKRKIYIVFKYALATYSKFVPFSHWLSMHGNIFLVRATVENSQGKARKARFDGFLLWHSHAGMQATFGIEFRIWKRTWESGLSSEYWITCNLRAPWVSSALSFIGWVHIGKSAACPKFDMVWLHHSPIPVGRRGVISSFKWFLPAFPRVEEGGWGSAPCEAK